MMRVSTIRDSEATTLSSSSSIDGGRVTHSYTHTHTLSLSLSLSLAYPVTEATTFSNYLTMIVCYLLYNVCPSFIYTYTTFKLFTNMAYTGHIRTIYKYSLPSWSRNRFSILISVLVSASTWLDISFPSLCRHTFNFSADNTLVGMCHGTTKLEPMTLCYMGQTLDH